MDTWDRPEARGRMRLRSIVVVLALALVVGWLALAAPESVRRTDASPGEAAEVTIERSAPDGQTPLPRVGAPPWRPPARGTWAALPDAPVGSRVGHVVADLDAAAVSGTATAQPQGVDREGADTGGGGVGVVVWGGFQSGRPLDTAASFDIAAGRWERIANSPEAEDGHVGVAAGPLLVLLHERTPMTYDAERDFWQVLPPPPLDAELLVTGVSAFTGRLAVALTATPTGRPGPVLAYDVVTGSWLQLPPPPGRLTNDHALVWDGADLLLFGRGGDVAFGHRLDFGTANARVVDGATWEPLPSPPVSAEVLDTAAVRAVATGSVRAGDPVYLWLGPRPGANPELPLLLSFDGGTNDTAWREAAAPSLRAATPELFWTGDDLLVVDPRGVASFDPQQRRFAPLPDAELAPGQLREAAWTGNHLLWWGGDVADGAVWRPPRASDVRDVVSRPDRLARACGHVPWDACADYRTAH